MTNFVVTDEDGESYERCIQAVDPKSAALQWAELTFHHRDYSLRPVAVVTENETGNVTRWQIETDSMPVFRAGYIGAGRNVDLSDQGPVQAKPEGGQ